MRLFLYMITLFVVISNWLQEKSYAFKPDRCNPADFNEAKCRGRRAAVPEEEMTKKPKFENPVMERYYMAHRRHIHDEAPVYRFKGFKKGQSGKFIVSLFTNDKGGKFDKKYHRYIKDSFKIGDGKKGATVFSMECNASTLKEVCNTPEVAFVEEELPSKMSACAIQPIFNFTTQRFISSWGLTRVDERSLPLDGIFKHDAVDKDNRQRSVFVYVVDSGIAMRKDQFGNRLRKGEDFTGGRNPFNDTVGHGTHVAGTVGSMTFGVAKNVKIFSVKVADATLTFSSFTLAKALEWTQRHAKKHRKRNKAVVNLSLSGPASKLNNVILTSMVEEGITVVAAAGNEAQDACCTTPSSANGVIGVGCTEITDRFCGDSNWGTCVDILAPGRTIRSVSNIGKDPSFRSGTSMSSPLVSGASAVLIARAGKCGLSPAKVKEQLLEIATKKKKVPTATLR